VNKIFGIKEFNYDRYGRCFGMVFLDGKKVKSEMVEALYAEPNPGTPAAGFDSTLYWKVEGEAIGAKNDRCSQGDRHISLREWGKANSKK